MESVLGVVQSPIFLSGLVLLCMASFISVLLARDPSLKRAHGCDRRASKMPELPFHDGNGVLISENRRAQLDRRRARLLAMQHKMNKDGAMG